LVTIPDHPLLDIIYVVLYIVDASYLGTPYFKLEEVDMLKVTKVNGEMTSEAVIRNILDERLERRNEEAG
jgi:hypothetical protein